MDGGAGTCWSSRAANNPCANDPDVGRVDDFWDWYWIPELHQNPDTNLADEVFAEYGVGPHRAYHLYDRVSLEVPLLQFGQTWSEKLGVRK